MFRSKWEFFRMPRYKENTVVKRQYDCDLCEDGGWSSETDLEIHRRGKHLRRLYAIAASHNKGKPVCLTCITRLKTISDLVKHIKTEHLFSSENAIKIEREIFICNDCHQIFFNKSHLAVHIANKHTKIKYVDCPVCPKVMKLRNIFGHLLLHQMKSVSCCPICLVKCVNRAAVREHLKIHQKSCQCLCGFKTSQEENLSIHMDKCSKLKKDDTVPDTWKVCKQYFYRPKSKDDFVYPLTWSGVHGVSIWNKVYICLFCRQICLSRLKATQHLKYHGHAVSTATKKLYICSCGEEFFNSVLLKHHIFKLKETHRILSEKEIQELKNRQTDEADQIEPVLDRNIDILDGASNSSYNPLTSVVVIELPMSPV